MDFDQELIEKCVAALRPNVGKCGFIVVLVKAKDDQQLMAATNLVPDVSLPALANAHAYLQQLDKDAKEMASKMLKEAGIDGHALGDGNRHHRFRRRPECGDS